MRKILAIMFVMMGFLPAVAKADFLPDDHHQITSCVRIDNISDYPDYNFVLSGTYKFPYSAKLSGTEECGHGGTANILAIKKTDWGKIKYAAKGTEEEGDWSMNPANAALFVTSSLNLELETVIPDTDPTVRKSHTIHIDSVTDESVRAHLVQTETTAKDGSKDFVLDLTNEEDRDSTDNSSLLILAALVGGGLLGLGLGYRAWKK